MSQSSRPRAISSRQRKVVERQGPPLRRPDYPNLWSLFFQPPAAQALPGKTCRRALIPQRPLARVHEHSQACDGWDTREGRSS